MKKNTGGIKLEKLMVQPDLCDGCLDCEGACCELYGTSRISIREVEGGYYPIVCQQCEDAPCKAICPTEAMVGKGVEEEKCIACGLCMMVCPFGAVTIENKAQKCNQCEGRKEEPGCIKSCSKRAIALLDINKINARKQEEHLTKLSGIGKKSKKSSGLINILTSGTRANKSYKE